MKSDREKARALIVGIRNAISEGVKHYDKNGNQLTTVKAVIEALNRDGEVQIIPPAFSNVIPIRRNLHGKPSTTRKD